MRMLDESLYVLQVNGVWLHYAVQGEGAPIVLVHGNGEDHHLFDTEIRQLTEAGYRVYAPDSRGHGANERLSEYHYADMAEDMFQFIRALGLEKPTFYGHSDGGIIGLMLELMHPGTLSRLAVSGANLSPEGLQPGFLRECKERNAQCADPLVTLMLSEPQIAPESLEGIAIPVLVTAGEEDLVLREETLRIARHLRTVHAVIAAGEDHGSYVSESPVMGALLLEFLCEEPKKAITVTAHPRFLDTVTDFAAGALEREGCPEETRTHMDAAVREAFDSICRHGYAGTVTVRVSCADGVAELAIVDGGNPLDSLESEDGDGADLSCVKRAMDGIEYQRADGQNVLRMYKRFRTSMETPRRF